MLDLRVAVEEFSTALGTTGVVKNVRFLSPQILAQDQADMDARQQTKHADHDRGDEGAVVPVFALALGLVLIPSHRGHALGAFAVFVQTAAAEFALGRIDDGSDLLAAAGRED